MMDEIDRVVARIMGYLNLKTGARFKARTTRGPTNAGTLIKNRLADGIHPDDLIRVIDAKFEQWHDSHMAQFLRPSTLFRKSKCEGYVGQLGVKIKTKDTSTPRDWLDKKEEVDHEIP